MKSVTRLCARVGGPVTLPAARRTPPAVSGTAPRSGLAVGAVPTGPEAHPAAVMAAAARRQDQGLYGRAPVGFSVRGDPYREQPGAPLTPIEYTACLGAFYAPHAAQLTPALFERCLRPGRVHWVLRDFPLANRYLSPAKERRAVPSVVRQVAPSWHMRDHHFAIQGQWNQLLEARAILSQRSASTPPRTSSPNLAKEATHTL